MLDVTTVLNAAVRQGLVNFAQAEQLRVAITPTLMPLEVLATDIPESAWQAVFFELYALSGGTSTNPTINEARERIAALKIAELLKVHERLQDNFERRNHRMAVGLFFGNSVETWQRSFWDSVVFLLLAQAVLGAGGIPGTLQKARLEAKLRREAAFLRRFALAVMLGMAGANGPRTPSDSDRVSNRSNLYSGVPRGEFYTAMEERLASLTNEEVGWLVEYIPKDDDSTCEPCHAAAGYYLPNQGPKPGEVCQGRGRCRCRRVPRFLPEIFAKLREKVL